MTLFEYVSVAISLVLSLAVVRLLSGLSYALAADRRYWVHLLWMAFVLLMIALHWWNEWVLRDLDDWNFLMFASLLVVPGLLYFQASVLIPDTPAEVRSWRDHFFAARRRFFIALALTFVTLFATGWAWLDIPVIHPLRAGQAMLVSLSVVGAVAQTAKVHAVLAPIALALAAGSIPFVFFQAGGFAQGG